MFVEIMLGLMFFFGMVVVVDNKRSEPPPKVYVYIEKDIEEKD